jgi:hypothetical protein
VPSPVGETFSTWPSDGAQRRAQINGWRARYPKAWPAYLEVVTNECNAFKAELDIA